MTYEEAIKHIDVVKSRIRGGDEAYDLQRKEALNIAIEALEKQIPKKPLKDGYMNLCPCCESEEIECELELYDGREETRFEFCPHCGQKIDWSDDE